MRTSSRSRRLYQRSTTEPSCKAPAPLQRFVKLTAEEGSIQRFGTDAPPGPLCLRDNVSHRGATRDCGDLSRQFRPYGPPRHDSCKSPSRYPGPIKSARLYITALGSYRASINGQAGRRRGAHTRLHRLPQTRHLPDLRRLLARTKPETMPSTVVLGSGWYGSGMTWAGSYQLRHGTAGLAGATRDRRRRWRAHKRGHRLKLAHLRLPHPELRDLRGRDLRRSPRVRKRDRSQVVSRSHVRPSARRAHHGAQEDLPVRRTARRPPGESHTPGQWRHRLRHGAEHRRLGAA